MENLLESELVIDILDYKHSGVINRYASQESLTLEVAKEDFKECLKFLYLCANSNGIPCSPSNRLDKVWHHFILFTRDYYNFCDEYFGKFIHHNPTEGSNSSLYMDTRNRAESIFGLLDQKCWPILDATCCQDGCCQHGDR